MTIPEKTEAGCSEPAPETTSIPSPEHSSDWADFQARCGDGEGEIIEDGGRGQSTPKAASKPVRLEDFVSIAPTGEYLFQLTGRLWKPQMINSRIPPIATGKNDATGKAEKISATAWLDRNNSCEDKTWMPGYDGIIRDRHFNDTGVIERPGARVFNLYRPPTIIPRKGDATPWLRHLSIAFPTISRTSSGGWLIASSARARKSTTASCSAAIRASARTQLLCRSGSPSGRGTLAR
jgi:hypothetical protein